MPFKHGKLTQSIGVQAGFTMPFSSLPFPSLPCPFPDTITLPKRSKKLKNARAAWKPSVADTSDLASQLRPMASNTVSGRLEWLKHL